MNKVIHFCNLIFTQDKWVIKIRPIRKGNLIANTSAMNGENQPYLTR